MSSKQVLHKREAEKDRHSRTGVSGKPKKGGAGGKGVWGKPGIDDLAQQGADASDPGVGSDVEEDTDVVFSVVDTTSEAIRSILKEYLISGDLDEAVESLKELNLANSHTLFIKKSILTALESNAFERELVSRVVAFLSSVDTSAVEDGFTAVLAALPDAVLDTPQAPTLVANFLARAIVDDAIQPKFIRAEQDFPNPLAADAASLARGLVDQKLASARLAHIWGAGDMRSVKRLKEEVGVLIQEYLVNGDNAEADKSLRKLNAPDFHFYLVKRAVLTALEFPQHEQKVHSLLSSFAKEWLVSAEQMEKGIKVCFDTLADIKLDIPTATQGLVKFVTDANQQGWLPKLFDKYIATALEQEKSKKEEKKQDAAAEAK